MLRPPHPQLVACLAAHDPAIANLALQLRRIVLEEASDAGESIYLVHTIAMWFGYGEQMRDWFCYITIHKAHVNLGFPFGTSLPDPGRILQGSAKTMRHISFDSMSDLDRPYVRRFIQAAMEQVPNPRGGSGLSEIKGVAAKGKPKSKSKKRP